MRRSAHRVSCRSRTPTRAARSLQCGVVLRPTSARGETETAGEGCWRGVKLSSETSLLGDALLRGDDGVAGDPDGVLRTNSLGLSSSETRSSSNRSGRVSSGISSRSTAYLSRAAGGTSPRSVRGDMGRTGRRREFFERDAGSPRRRGRRRRRRRRRRSVEASASTGGRRAVPVARNNRGRAPAPLVRFRQALSASVGLGTGMAMDLFGKGVILWSPDF